MRTLTQDTDGLRFWGLNPAIPKAGPSYISLKSLLYSYK